MTGYIRYIGVLACIAAFSFSASADSLPKPRFVYDMDFEMNFDNREYYSSRFSNSMTIFGVRMTPSVGMEFRQENGLKHRVMAGIDMMKDFGASISPDSVTPPDHDELSMKQLNTDLFHEITLWYSLNRKSGKTDFSLLAGIFPRKAMEGRYSTAFFSDSLRFYDNNLEGILLKLSRPKAYFELGCDWMGQFGDYRREKFMIYSSGEGEILPMTRLGYSAYMYHFACSRDVDGVVDNILLNPYIEIDAGRKAGLQKLAFTIGWLQAMQHDRKNVGHYVFPHGGELVMDIRNWNVGIRNNLFVGYDMMPYYTSKDKGGFSYGERLYLGDPFYRIHDTRDAEGTGIYDMLEIYYEPVTGRYLNISLSARFHFHGKGYSGCQQMFTLRFNLQELISR